MSEFLKRMQSKEDASGRQIRFWNRQKPFNNIGEVIDLAFQMRPTESTGKVRKEFRSQKLGSKRSLQDLYLLCKYYFPETTIFEVVDYLKIFYKSKNLSMSYCCTFNRMMFHKGSNPYYTNQNERHTAKRYGLI